jgi:Uma2 family endonuclease
MPARHPRAVDFTETIMSVATLPRHVTPEELLAMPDNSSMELVDGQIVEKQVSSGSSKIEGRFFFHFMTFVQAHPGLAEVFPASLGYQCFDDDPGKVRKPDTTVVRLERLKALPNPDPGYMPIVPDLAVEVISPNDSVYEVDKKVEEYLDAGFPLVWVADPRSRTVTVHPNGGKPVIFTAEDELTAESALPGFKCGVGDFFE